MKYRAKGARRGPKPLQRSLDVMSRELSARIEATEQPELPLPELQGAVQFVLGLPEPLEPQQRGRK
jgi:hypothetical protein